MRLLTAAVLLACTALSGLCVDHSHASLTMMLPGADEPQTYEIEFFSDSVPSDTLSPLNYLIEWTSTTPAGVENNGFSAYFDGHFYRGSDGDIAAYDYATEPERFVPGGTPRAGVQCSDAFLPLIPSLVKEATGGRTEVSESRDGVELSRAQYEYDAAGRPVRGEKVLSPDTRQEQSQTIIWSYPASGELTAIDLPTLRARHPAEFATLDMRRDGAVGLVGHQLPGFYAPAADGGRFVYTSGEGFRKPLIIIALEDASDRSISMLTQLCEAGSKLKGGVEIMAIFSSNRLDRITAAMGATKPNITLYSARKALRELGVSKFPTLIAVAPDGMVMQVVEGENNDLSSFVISVSENLNN